MDKTVVFLVGAGRSGTTLLYKMLSLHPEVGFISNYDTRLPSWLGSSLLVRLARGSTQMKLGSWFGTGGNAYLRDRPWLKTLVPTPAEGEDIYTSCGFPLFPKPDERLPAEVINCLRKRFSRMHLLAGTQVFITKRTANNRRIPLILEAFPDARFINLIRDGRDVAYSLSKVYWWKNSTVFWAGSTPPELEKQGMHPLEICARNWTEEVTLAQQGLEGVNERNKLEVRYESLLAEPIEVFRQIMGFLQLELTDGFRTAIESLELSQQAPKWEKEWSEQDLDQVLKQQRNLLQELAYL